LRITGVNTGTYDIRLKDTAGRVIGDLIATR